MACNLSLAISFTLASSSCDVIASYISIIDYINITTTTTPLTISPIATVIAIVILILTTTTTTTLIYYAIHTIGMALQQQHHQQIEISKVIDALLDAITGFNAVIKTIMIYSCNDTTHITTRIDLEHDNRLIVHKWIRNDKVHYSLCINQIDVELDECLTALIERLWNRILNNGRVINIINAFNTLKAYSNVDLMDVCTEIEL
jgi:hypothetical protein